MRLNTGSSNKKLQISPNFFATPNKGNNLKGSQTSRYTSSTIFTKKAPYSQSAKKNSKSQSKILSVSISNSTTKIMPKIVNMDSGNISTINEPESQAELITNEILDALRQKLLKIEEQQKIQSDKKRMLSVSLVKSRDELMNIKGNLDTYQKSLYRLEYNNQKLQEDCDSLQSEINDVQEEINVLQRDSEDNIALMKSEIFAKNAKREKETATLIREREETSSYEKSLMEHRSIKQQQVEEISKELDEIKDKLKMVTEKEGNRLEKFLNKIHSIDVSINIIKATKENEDAVKSALLHIKK